jgi:WD40 repeat protein
MKAMIRMTLYSLAPAAVLAAMTLTAAQPASADEFNFPAGQACQDFGLRLERTGGNLQTVTFTDKNGNDVTLVAGKGFLLTYTNLNSGKSVTIRTDGSVSSTRISPDKKTFIVTATGHNGLILFPEDVPAGPTTTQYIGRIVYTIDAETGVFTLLRTSGSARDICAELAG